MERKGLIIAGALLGLTLGVSGCNRDEPEETPATTDSTPADTTDTTGYGDPTGTGTTGTTPDPTMPPPDATTTTPGTTTPGTEPPPPPGG